EKDGSLAILAMEKEQKTGGRSITPTWKTRTSGAQSGPSVGVVCFSTARHERSLPSRGGCMLLLRDDRSVDSQKGGSAKAQAILLWNGLPQPLACLFAAIPKHRGDHLTRLAAQSHPHPGVVGFVEHKRAIRSSSSRVVEAAFSGSGRTKVVRQ